MESHALQENRRHGDLLFPVGSYRIRTRGGTVLDCHWHRELELLKVLKGEFRARISSSFYDVKEGDLLFVNSGELHAAHSETGAEAVFEAVVFSPDLLRGPSEDRIQMEYLVPLLNGAFSVPRHFSGRDERERELLKTFDSVYRLLEERPPAYEISVKAGVYALFALLAGMGRREAVSPGGNAAAETVKSGIRYLQDHYRSRVTVEELAAFCHVSRGYFCRIFRKYTAESPGRYLTRLRLAEAAGLLGSTDRKVLNVALDCGFGSQSYFIRVFEKNMGVSPSEYRKREKKRPGR